jgi:hypothetical protein
MLNYKNYVKSKNNNMNFNYKRKQILFIFLNKFLKEFTFVLLLNNFFGFL